ncbi:MAG: hypothetical protein LLG01_04500 [Planctomycetaceae bacterium]|nr:hypothetical protein [Planctomycetaceae bacterium]
MKPMNTDWFSAAKWGVFCHYSPEPGFASWNEQIDKFDVTTLVKQLVAAQAKYFFITLTHGHGKFMGPCRSLDELLETSPAESYCSKRDLIADIADALAPHEIRVMAYIPACGVGDAYMLKKLRWIDGQTLGWGVEGNTVRPGRRPVEFMRNWEAVIREFSLRWGKKVHGWWVDACYWPEHIYRSDAEPNYRSLVSALKAGNPDSIVALNGGLETPILTHSEYEDFTAGEVGHLLPLGTRMTDGQLRQVTRFIDGTQYHILTHIGSFWGRSPLRFPVELVIGYTKYLNDRGAVITWDTGIEPNGHLQADALEQLVALGKATR